MCYKTHGRQTTGAEGKIMVCIELSEEGNLLHKEPHDKGAEAGGENTGKASRCVRPEGAKQQVTSLHFPLTNREPGC